MADDDTTGDGPDSHLEAFRRRIDALEQRAGGKQALLIAHTLMSHFPSGLVFLYDHDLRYLLAEGAILMRGGITRDSLEGHTIWEALPPETCAIIEPTYRAALEGRIATLQLPFADGHFELTTVPVHDDHDTIIAGMAIVRDITSRMRREDDLRESEARNRALINTIPDQIFLVNAEGFFIDYKTESDRLAEWPTTYKGRRVIDVLPPDLAERLLTRVAEVLRTGEMQTFEYQIPLNGVLTYLEGRIVLSGASNVLFMTRDISPRKREEQERQEMQEQLIAVQQAALRELATPLIPLAEGVIVMPLVGVIDSNRAQQILETLLEGIAARQADIAILDITGVRVVDTQVADALLRAAQAAKLLGSQVVLTGIGPEIAQTLVTLGGDLSGIVTRSSLQSGIAYALERR
jgi:rsbT co-antagonist protein RsbR